MWSVIKISLTRSRQCPELRALNGSWFHDIDFSKELYNLIPNPDKFDDADPDLALTSPVSDYYTLPQINKFIDINKQNDLFLYHCNIRSLPKNLSLFPVAFSDFLNPVHLKHNYNTRLASKLNFCRPHVRTNYGKFTFKYAASVLWETIPYHMKHLPFKTFKRKYMLYLLSQQNDN